MIPDLPKSKFIINTDLTLAQFKSCLLKNKRIHEKYSYNLFINGRELINPNAETVGDVYERFRDPDGFLYILYTDQETFGTDLL